MSFEAVKSWCLARVGEGYIYGAKGQTCSEAFRMQQAAQYPAQASTIMSTGAKWDGHPVWDCAQLTRYAAKQGGVELVSGATSQWRKTNWKDKGVIGLLPSDEIAFLYAEDTVNGGMKHTGVYLGDGTFVHAKGTAYGVLRQSMNEYNWTHWAVPYWVEAEEDEPMEALYGVKVIGGTLNVRADKRTDSERVGRLPDGTLATVYEEDSEWLYIKATVGGERVCGWVLKEYTEPYKVQTGAEEEPEAEEDDDVGTVTLKLEFPVAKALLEALMEAMA